jgi:transmembrane sensor
MKPRATPLSSADIDAVASNWVVRCDAGLNRAEETEFRRWQAQDPRHAEAVTRKQHAWSALGRPLQAGQAGGLLERLEQRAAGRRQRRVRAAMAGVAVFVLAAALMNVQKIAPSAGRDERGAVILPETRRLVDGTVVELRPGADVQVDYSGGFRRVWLARGEAYFQVAKDSSRPFIVTAAGVDFQAVGTAFSVGVDDGHVDIVVTEGRVAVSSDRIAARPESGRGPVEAVSPVAAASRAAGDEPAARMVAAPEMPPVVVGAGSRLVVERVPIPTGVSPPMALSSDEIAQRLAWRAPKLEFSELPLAEAIALINRYNRVQFAIAEPGLARLRISGVFRADNTDTFVRLLEGTCGIQAERSGDRILLRTAPVDGVGTR